MIAEFYGLPGSGKTTTMNNLISSTKSGKIMAQVHGRDLKKSRHIRNIFSMEYMYFTYLLLHLYFKKKKRKKHDFHQIKIMLRLYLIYMQERDREDREKIHCFDHGLVQTLLSFVWTDTYLRDSAAGVIKYVARKFSKSVIFVYAKNNNIHAVYDRIIHREKDLRILDFSAEQAEELLAFQKTVFDDAETIFKKDGCSIVINTQKTLEDNVRYLRDALEA